MSSNQSLNQELRESKRELQEINEQIMTLRSRKRQLETRIKSMETTLQTMSHTSNDSRFDGNEFEWSKRVEHLLQAVFKLKTFRSYQLMAINATLSGSDCVLVMPTGGGKSLCFQLPALIGDGLTVVVSPLISLMEDQMNGLKALNIPTAVISGQTTREENNEILKSMADPKGTLILVYVTPEKMAKSKRFMSQMEKCYRNKRLNRIVIDEVHCCSQWGHDFRPDYQFLGVMKTQFPDTPILGLTATATSAVILDIQKILSIEGCIVLKDSFFRSNLRYFIKKVDYKREEQIEKIAKLLKTKYAKQSGIIYCLTIKDVEEVTEKLKSLGVKAGAYHAQLEPQVRSHIHRKWSQNLCQVIVATVAFGMGINKLDLRFVIHFSMSKSLENYYQETGRAGRDGQPADCLLYYRFQDVFRTTSLVFSEKNGLSNVYSMLAYCLNDKTCRKEQMATYFGDKWKNNCDQMCDNCMNRDESSETDVTKHLLNVNQILNNASKMSERMTALKLMDAWFAKGNKKLRVDGIQSPSIGRNVCEQIIGLLLIDGYLKEEFHFTPYSTISYLTVGSRSLTRSKDMKITYFLNSLSQKRSNKTPKVKTIKKQKTSDNKESVITINDNSMITIDESDDEMNDITVL
ncbi:unnamed protein product [Medioppia subpectinata]|uniref:ATP-dependent DNA helicase n=1 Tax=Medioppia subpectinata TaxID=1979941 RepID=A0A7R9KV84_9ACAR|nr:unnamed protein product [Medioppia subpectinata]CAG2110502.1 unnamed protein product [Medioppia subpectinata]